MEILFLSTATDTWTILLIFSSSLVEHHCALLTYSNASSGKKTWLNCESMITQTFSDFDGSNEEETIKINKLMMNFEFVLLIHIVMWIAGDLDSYVNSWVIWKHQLLRKIYYFVFLISALRSLSPLLFSPHIDFHIGRPYSNFWYKYAITKEVKIT